MDLARYEIQVSVEPVHPCAFCAEPGSAVDPGSPLAEVGCEVRQVAVVQLAGQLAKSFGGGMAVRMMVDSEVHVRIEVRLSSGPRAAEHHGFDAFDIPEPLRDVLRQPHAFHLPALTLH